MTKKRFKDFFDAWHWLDEHPIFKDKWGGSRFRCDLTIMVVKVDPKTNRVAMVKGQRNIPDESRNTATRVWLEHGPFQSIPAEEAGGYEWNACSHDIDIDCGAATFEEAIVKLARLVMKKYGDYEEE